MVGVCDETVIEGMLPVMTLLLPTSYDYMHTRYAINLGKKKNKVENKV